MPVDAALNGLRFTPWLAPVKKSPGVSLPLDVSGPERSGHQQACNPGIKDL